MLDFIAVGLGPFNLSLASLLQQKSKLKYLFLKNKLSLIGMQECSFQTQCCKCLLWLI